MKKQALASLLGVCLLALIARDTLHHFLPELTSYSNQLTELFKAAFIGSGEEYRHTFYPQCNGGIGWTTTFQERLKIRGTNIFLAPDQTETGTVQVMDFDKDTTISLKEGESIKIDAPAMEFQTREMNGKLQFREVDHSSFSMEIRPPMTKSSDFIDTNTVWIMCENMGEPSQGPEKE